MNNDSFDPLDKHLGDWAASRRPDDQHTRRLANRILSAAMQQEKSDRDRSANKAMPQVKRDVVLQHSGTEETSWDTKLVIRFSGLLALAALVGFIVLSVLPSQMIDDRESTRAIAGIPGNRTTAAKELSDYPMTVGLDAGIVSAKQQLLAESNALFDHQLAWIADGQKEVLFEMRDSGSNDSREFILVRVVVARRDSVQAPWSTVWQTDVISRDEEFVEVKRDHGDRASIILWTHRISEGEVVVEMDLKLDQLTGQHASSTSVVRVGQPTRVRRSSENGVEYGVFQSVMPLPEIPLPEKPLHGSPI